MNRSGTSCFTLALLLLASPAVAGVVFSDFPVGGTDGGAVIAGSASASDSFTLASPAVINSVNFGAWKVSSSEVVSSVVWEIGSTFFGSDYGSGTAAITSDTYLTTFDGYPVDELSFAFSDISLPAGTYYLTLESAVATEGDSVWWDRNLALVGSGISAEEFYNGSNYPDTTPSTFQLLNTPEPSTAILFACGLMAAALRRRRARG